MGGLGYSGWAREPTTKEFPNRAKAATDDVMTKLRVVTERYYGLLPAAALEFVAETRRRLEAKAKA
jgi:hypothetical protein